MSDVCGCNFKLTNQLCSCHCHIKDGRISELESELELAREIIRDAVEHIKDFSSANTREKKALIDYIVERLPRHEKGER